MIEYFQFGTKVTPWIICSMCCLLLAIGFNAAGLATEQWGYEEVSHSDFLVTENQWIVVPDYNVRYAMLTTCNTTNTIDANGNWHLDTICFRTNEIAEGWIPICQGLLVLGAAFAFAALLAFFAFAIMTCKSEKNKSVVAAVIPTCFVAAIFNLIAAVAAGTGLAARNVRLELSFILVCCAVVCYTVAGILAIADMQHLCVKKRPAIGKGLVRPI